MNEDLEIAYLAGVFDSEGCISSIIRKETKRRRGTVRPIITISMTWLPTLNKFFVRFGGTLRQEKKVEMRKTLFRWRLANFRQQLYFLQTIAPFLGEKRIQADLLIEYLTIRMQYPDRRMPLHVFDLSKRLHTRLRSEKKVDFGG